MDEETTLNEIKRIDAVICIDAGVYARYRAVLRHLCVGLIDEISSVRLLTSAAQAQSLTLGPVKTVLYKPLRWPQATKRFHELAAALADRPPSVVHAMSAQSFDVAQRVAAEFDADLVYEITALQDVAALHVSRSGKHRIICASQPLVDQCIQKFGRARTEISLIRPGVICASEPTCFRDEDNIPTILSTADFTKNGGVDTLLNALKLIKERNHKFLAILLGKGPTESRLRALTRKLGLDSIVVFARFEGDILKAMVGADIFVQPLIEDSISARSVQALGQGMAVVSVAGSVNDAYINGETAVLAKHPTPNDLAGAIESLLVDHELAQQLGANAITHMKNNHTMSAMAENTAQVYQNMAEQRQPATSAS